MSHICKVKADPIVMAVLFDFSLRQVGAVVGDDAIPNLTTMSLTKFKVVLPSSFLMGLASTHFVNLSSTTERCVNPEGAVFSGHTMSSPQSAKGNVIGMVWHVGLF
jgi:hypothetical protein